MLSLLKPPEHLALYALPYKVLESLLFFPAMIGGMLLPVFSRAAKKRHQGVTPVLKAASDLYLLGSVPLAAVLFLLAPLVVVFLAGEAFLAAVPVLRILAVTLGILFLGNLYGNGIIAAGRQKSLVKIYVFLAFLNVAANLIFIPRYSYLGAAWTTLATEIVSLALAAAVLYRGEIGVAGTKKTPGIILSGIAMVLFFFLPLSLPVKVAGGLAVYLAFLLWTKSVLPKEVFDIIRAQKKYV